MRKRSSNDIGSYTSATDSQMSWPRFSVLVHPKSSWGGKPCQLKRELAPVNAHSGTTRRRDAFQQRDDVSKGSHQSLPLSFTWARLQALNSNYRLEQSGGHVQDILRHTFFHILTSLKSMASSTWWQPGGSPKLVAWNPTNEAF